MQPEKVDKLLIQISSREPLCITVSDFSVIKEMVEEGLIKPVNEGYSLTDYGKIIAAMGYETHQKQKSVKDMKPNLVCLKSMILFLCWLLAITSILTCVYYLSA